MAEQRSRRRRVLRFVLRQILIPTLVLLVLAEIVLRGAGVAPSGRFNFLLPAASAGLYPVNTTMEDTWGYVHFRVETDELGLRGTGVPREGRNEAARILTVGDSITQGFFVDNDATYQHTLQRSLDEAYGARYRVLNAARGGASIGEELAVLREIGLRLGPEIAILTFVTNDITDIGDKTVGELRDHPLPLAAATASLSGRMFLAFYTKTAVGEMIFRLYWHLFVKTRHFEPSGGGITPERYTIPGGSSFAANVERFRKRHGRVDGRILTETFPPEVQDAIDRYTEVLGTFASTCLDNDIVPVFAYFPSYPEIYDPATPATIRAHFAGACAEMSMHFLDLTETFRREGAERVLHLAPLDYHLNPAGNEVLGQAIFGFLRAQKLVR